MSRLVTVTVVCGLGRSSGVGRMGGQSEKKEGATETDECTIYVVVEGTSMTGVRRRYT